MTPQIPNRELPEVDPFDLPEWLGTDEIQWRTESGLAGHVIHGVLTSENADSLPCDLVAVDQAYPAPVCTDSARTRAHQAWHYGQVLLTTYDARLALAVPGRELTTDVILQAFTRLAKAVGAEPSRISVLVRLGGEPPGR